jgi:ElaB/YqjD/DUF883 family membrane-anchored ribosome-binding protein
MSVASADILLKNTFLQGGFLVSTNPDFARSEGVASGSTSGKGQGGGSQSQGGGGQPRGGASQAGSQSSTRQGGRMEDIGGEGGHEIREELQRVGQMARDAAYEQMDYLRERGLEKARQLEDRIVDEPLKSVAIAAGVGFVLGLMWMRR